MTVTEADRLKLHADLLEKFEDVDTARILMESLPPLPYDQFATKDGLAAVETNLRTEIGAVRTELKTEMADLRTEMADLRTELKTEMADLRTELKTEMADLRGDLKSEMAQNLRLIVASQLATMMMLGGWVAAVT